MYVLFLFGKTKQHLNTHTSYILNKKMLYLFPSRTMEGSVLVADSSNQPFPLLATMHSKPAGRIHPSHTLSLLLFLCLSNGFPKSCLPIPAPVHGIWRGPLSASQSHGPHSSSYFSLLSPPTNSTICPSFSDHIIFSSGSTLLLKPYGNFCFLPFPLCFCVFFLPHWP